MPDYTSSTNMPAWVQPYAQGYLQQAQQVANMPYQPYQGETVAGFTPWQQQGYQALAQRAADGSPLMGGAQQALQGMWSGQQPTATSNPYGMVSAGTNTSQVTPGQGGQAVEAGWNTSQVTPGQNQYATMDNPYLGRQVDLAQQDVIRNWNDVKMPGFDTAMSRSGSFGNENVRSVAAQGASDLQRNLGDISSRMRFQDYSQQQQLAENAVNRGMQAQQFNAGLMDTNLARRMQAGQFNAGLGEAAANRGMQAQQFNAGLMDTNLARQMQASQFNASQGQDWAQRNDAMYSGNQNRMLQALGLAPQYAQSDYNDINQLINAGSAYQGQNQAQMNDSYRRFQESRAYPQQQLDVMRQALGAFNPGSTTTQQQPGANPLASGLGGAMTFAQLWSLLGGGR